MTHVANSDKEFTCEYNGGCYSTRKDLDDCEFLYCAFRKRMRSREEKLALTNEDREKTDGTRA